MTSRRLLRAIAAEPGRWVDEMVSYIPGRTGSLFRQIWLRHRVASLGKSCSFAVGIHLDCGKNISIGRDFYCMRYSRLGACNGTLQIGDRVSLNSNVCVDASNGGVIIIGNDVLIGQNVVLRASNHEFGDIGNPINRQGHTGGRITVKDDVWLGANVVVVPNVTIGAHSVVAAGAVVTHNVEPYTIVGGVPARFIARRLLG